MSATLKSDQLTVEIQEDGAEVTSILGADGIEYLWWADDAFWAHSAPALFPIVGRLQGDHYTLDGKSYQIAAGGLAVQHRFEQVSSEPSCARFRLTDSDETRRAYPFRFSLDADYRVQGSELTVTYEVQNRDDRVLPFSIGGQPALSCAWIGQDVVTDYALEFEQPETASCPYLRDGLVTADQRTVLAESRRLQLAGDTFDDEDLIFSELQSSWIRLVHRRQPTSVQLAFEGFPNVIVWSRPLSPYVCIQPCHGRPDAVGAPSDLRSKPGMRALDPGATFHCAYRINVEGLQAAADPSVC